MPDNTQTRPYIAHTWQEGDTITADLLNAIEQGIASIDSEMVEARTDDPNGDKTVNTLGNRIDDLVMIQNTQPTSINNEIWVDSSETETIEIPSYEEYENLLNGIGEQYDENNGTYAVGDHVLHDSELYRCKVNITEPESWTPAHWENVSIADELSTFTDEIVKASDEQPTSTFNRIWIDSDTEEIDVPTMEEFGEVADDVADLKSAINDLIGDYMTLPTPTHGYYRGIVGETITYTGQETSTAYQIDCTQYIGYDIIVKYETTATGSTRETCLCDANDKIVARGIEKNITEDGFKFNITSNNYKLYVSFSELASNLSIRVINGRVAILETEVDVLKTKTSACYVNNSTGNDSNDGTVLYPLKTIGKAINKGYKNIFVKPDTYSERVNLYDLDNVTISPYGVPEYAEGTYESKIILDGIGTRSFGVYCTNCNNITLEGIEAKNFTTSGFRLIGCSNVKFIDCVAHDDVGTYQYANGFELINTNAEFLNCIAHDVALDGFNMHGYGSTSFVNCVAYDCGDDGLSHHNACIGVVNGGEFYGNGKGGISSPTYGSYVNIYNAYCHNNLYGIYTVISSGQRTSKTVISNCLVKNNTNKDLYLRGVNAIGYNNIYDTKTVGEDATFTEY